MFICRDLQNIKNTSPREEVAVVDERIARITNAGEGCVVTKKHLHTTSNIGKLLQFGINPSLVSVIRSAQTATFSPLERR